MFEFLECWRVLEHVPVSLTEQFKPKKKNISQPLFFFPEPNVLAGTLIGHTDAVWGLAYSGVKNHLLSCSADGTIRLWNPPEKMPCICTYNGEKGKAF